MTEEKPLSVEAEEFFERARLRLQSASPHYALDLARLFDEMTATMREQVKYYQREHDRLWEGNVEDVETIQGLREALEKKTEALKHWPSTGSTYGMCVECAERWPCDARRAALSEKGDGR